MIDPEIKRLAEELNQRIKNETVSDDERLNYVEQVLDGICNYCGGTRLPCFCQSDD